MRPIVDRVFGFEEAPDAFAFLEGSTHFGKVCIEFADEGQADTGRTGDAARQSGA